MKIDFGDIENAFGFVSSDLQFENSAVLDRESGEIYYKSDQFDDDDEKFPEDVEENNKYIFIPHKNDLELGRAVVFKFVSENLQDSLELVRNFFRHKGAYSKYKAWLTKIGKLQEWYDYENNAQSLALREWCRENEIDIESENCQMLNL
jgi:hypothetical protein